MKKIQYPSLNGLRVISILLVLMLHLSLKNNIFDGFSEVIWIQPLVLFLKDGAMGVNVFFVISGFLITSLLQEEQQNYGSISLKNFYIRRTLRIFPAYFFLLFVYFFLQSFSIIEISNASWLTSITYTKYLNGQLDWYTAHSWSLSLEELFYLFWPVVFIGGEKTRKTIAFSIVIAVLAVRTYIHFVDSVFVEQLFIFAKMDAIAIGCLFAIYKDYILKKISAYWGLVFYSSISALFFLRYFPLIASKIHLGFVFIPIGLTDGTLANILIALIMMYSVFGPKGLWFKILNLKVVNHIGILSYSIYLWQQIFISDLEYWVNKFPQNLVFVFIMALFSYYIIEKPFLRLKNRFSDKKEKKIIEEQAVIREARVD